jgi:hypothetical protein
VAYSFSASNPTNCAAIIAGNYSSTYGVYLNKATVYGYVTTFDKPITWTAGTGKVKGPTTAAGTDVDLTRVGKSAFIPMFDIVTPTGASVYTIDENGDSATYGTGASSPVILDAYDLYLSGGETLRIDGPVIIRVTHNFDILNNAKLQVTINGSLQIFVGNDINIGGTVGMQNDNTKEPKKMALFSTDNATSAINYTSSANFNGVIYSASKPVYVTSNVDFYGAILSGSWVYFSGTTYRFHYDLALRRVKFSGVDTPYLINELVEL